MLKFKKLNELARMPHYATAGAACFDMSAAIEESVMILPGQSKIISTGLAVEVPPNNVMLLFSRSGHGFKHNIRMSNCVGVIDSDYRGEVKASIYNDSHEMFVIEPFQRIVQAMIAPAVQVAIKLVDELSTTERGEGGFGSTGK